MTQSAVLYMPYWLTFHSYHQISYFRVRTTLVPCDLAASLLDKSRRKKAKFHTGNRYGIWPIKNKFLEIVPRLVASIRSIRSDRTPKSGNETTKTPQYTTNWITVFTFLDHEQKIFFVAKWPLMLIEHETLEWINDAICYFYSKTPGIGLNVTLKVNNNIKLENYRQANKFLKGIPTICVDGQPKIVHLG